MSDDLQFLPEPPQGLSDADHKSHEGTWHEMQPLFDREITLCIGGNFDFSTLAGAYISHIHYLSPAWYQANFRANAPYVSIAHNSDQFIEALSRLVDQNHLAVAEILGTMLKNYSLSYDYQDRIRNMIRRFSKHSDTRTLAFQYADQLGMLDLFREMAREVPP